MTTGPKSEGTLVQCPSRVHVLGHRKKKKKKEKKVRVHWYSALLEYTY